MRSLQRLAGHFLDVVAGLPTLKVFGRAKAQARAIADVTDRYRTTTMATLKVTFLSSLILELLATISVALVAVAVGLRLLDGHLNFHAALFVLVLAPEAYLPLRALGANFHASADGMKAAEEVFELLETPVTDGRRRGSVRPRDTASASTGLEVTYPGRRIPALHGADLVGRAGRDGGPRRPERLRQVHPPRRRPRTAPPRFGPGPARRGGPAPTSTSTPGGPGIGWVPQRPHLFARSIADNVRLGRPDASDARGARPRWRRPA